jgi:hypothetical protein
VTVLACGLPATGVMAAFNQLAPPPVTEVAAFELGQTPRTGVLHQERSARATPIRRRRPGR